MILRHSPRTTLIAVALLAVLTAIGCSLIFLTPLSFPPDFPSNWQISPGALIALGAIAGLVACGIAGLRGLLAGGQTAPRPEPARTPASSEGYGRPRMVPMKGWMETDNLVQFEAARLAELYEPNDPMLLLERYAAGQSNRLSLWQLTDLVARTAGSPVLPGDPIYRPPAVALAA